MRFGVQLYPWERWPDLRAVARAATAIEEMGYDSLVFAEHLVTPLAGPDRPVGRTWPEIYVVAAFLAASTATIRFVFNATVVPLRHPIHQANQIATLDQLSNGRLTVVAGAGWLEAEFDALAVPFDTRGRRTDEYLRAMRALWTEDEAEFHGEHVSFDKVCLEPKCVQRPHVPILMGGRGAHVRRRIAELGDGWSALTPAPNDEVEREVVTTREAVAATGRDPAMLRFMGRIDFVADRTGTSRRRRAGSEGQAPAVESSAARIIGDVRHCERAGFTDLIVSTDWTTPEDYCDKLGWFADHVIARTAP